MVTIELQRIQSPNAFDKFLIRIFLDGALVCERTREVRDNYEIAESLESILKFCPEILPYIK